VEDQCRLGLFGAANDLRGDGKQYLAIISGPSGQATKQLVNTTELKDQRNSLMLYVFGL
jgi:hypothetical protein